MTDELMINILMADGCHYKDAKKHVEATKKHFGYGGSVMIWEDPNEYLQNLKDNDCYDGETIDGLRKGAYRDVSMVDYDGHEYVVEYIL